MRLLVYRSGSEAGIGVVDGDKIFPLEYLGSMIELIADYSSHPDRIDELSTDRTVSLDDVKVLPPIRRPGKIVCLGRNYVAHAEESGMSVPDEPIIFPKASSAVIGHGDNIIHQRICERVDHEVELAVVIGERSSRVKRQDAMGRVFGYTVLNDVSAREMQKRDLELQNPWFRSKSLDTFCPMGPWIVLPDQVEDPQDLSLECRVNSDVRQRGNTRDMIFGIDRLIEFISLHMTLEPGDIISTGTPEGISPIVPGDLVECEVEGIGTLANRVIPDSED